MTVGSMLIAGFSAWVAWRQRGDAQAAAQAASEDAEAAKQAALRTVSAQERIAAGLELDRRRVEDSQAKRIRLRGSQQAGGRGRVKVSNASSSPIFDVRIHSIVALVDGVETAVDLQPNPYMHPVIREIDRIDGHTDRDLYPFFGEDWPRHQWSPLVRFRDANQVEWEINLAGDVARVDE